MLILLKLMSSRKHRSLIAVLPVLVALVSGIIFFSLAEYGARIWVEHRGNALSITKKILEADATLGWKQRPNLDTTFLSIPLQTNEAGWRTHPLSVQPSAGPLVLVLGPSSTFGWGVAQADTYSSQLEALLASSTPAEVLNAGEIGYSTDQGVRLFSQSPADTLKPAVVVIAYGVNDLDRSRFYFQSSKTDAQEFSQPESSKEVGAINTLYSSALLDTLINTAGALRSSFSMPPVPAYPADPVPGVRVPADDFAANIRSLIQTARSRGAAPVLLSTVVDLPATTSSPAALDAFAQAKSAWSNGDTTAAKGLLISAVSLDPTLCEAYYYLAALYAHDGDGASARESFGKARATESYRISRDVAAYNVLLQGIAAQEHVPLLNLADLFAGRDPKDLFVDPIHFSPKGNALVARGLQTIIRSNGLLP